jgi:23S rRNA (pseudouridine1915-N3)-methyltransferase
MREEGDKLLAAAPRRARIFAMDVAGHHWDTEQLAEQLASWLQDGRDLAMLVGGPDGLDPNCLERAELRWSLSRLTLPHPLVRILVAEQIYRAWSLLKHHPYHRA